MTAITTIDREPGFVSSPGARRNIAQYPGMINYTDQIARLMGDLVHRVPDLSYIDLSRVLVFARFGRSDAEGAYATCHAISLPSSEPSYYFWRDRRTGEMTRRSEWFVTKSPTVQLGDTTIDYMISFCMPRFCDQTIARAHKQRVYPGAEPWVAKLDTIVHELYHIDPSHTGIRRLPRRDGGDSHRTHSPGFFRAVSRMVREYLASGPDPEVLEFLRHDFAGLQRRYGRVVGTAFRTFPSYPQRYLEVVADQAIEVEPNVRIEPVRTPATPTRYTDADLAVREFKAGTSRRLRVHDDRAA